MLTSKTKVLFRVDASPELGLGHLQRCLSLATALRQLEAACVFLTNENTLAGERVARFGFDCRTIGAAESFGVDDVERTLEMAASQNCSAIVVDSEYEGAEYLIQLRSAGFYVCAIEDIAPHPFPCQMVVNGDAHARQLPYDLASEDTLFLLGPEYSILGADFWHVPSRTVRDGVQNILVTLGGADPYNLMPRVLDSLGQLPGAFTITAITGPFFGNLAEVEAAARRAQGQVNLVHAPDSTCELMIEADLAVSAGGQTMYELACVGGPTVAVRIASNQDGQLQVFDEVGFALPIGRADDDNIASNIGDAVKSLLPDSESRAAMAAAGQRLVAGQGAMRVAQAILTEVSRTQDGSALTQETK